MKKYIYSLLFSVVSIFSLAQETTFNNIYEYDNYHLPSLNDLIVHGDTIVGYGMAKNVEQGYAQGLVVIRFDTSGHLLDTLVLMSPLGGNLDWH